ncbi:MAG: glycoside hydrolase family 99-like domain-containing protein [Sedimenticola sp.]
MKECQQINPVPQLDAEPIKDVPTNLIAFYLPQFHQIPENDAWWGKGFTEWTNVKRATPQFNGHYQPHIPGNLGYYDLDDADILGRQVNLAKLYGIGGFCFYFYWFAGKRLLEKPIRRYLSSSELDLPFCLCWANENWTRRWDGQNSDILIAQQHSEIDDIEFIKYISQYFRDPRYIRVQGNPLLLVYRPALLPSPRKTAKRWRKWCQENGIGAIHLAYTQSFESANPKRYGFDSAVEFPPNNIRAPIITGEMDGLNDTFSGVIYDYSSLAKRSYLYKRPDYLLYRGVCTSWDNTARRMNNASVFLGSSPSIYGRWLESAVMDTVKHIEDKTQRLVFVNAWNEWAEGARLEPDQKYGYAYLQATRDSLERVKSDLQKKRIVLVAHDAHPHGAQYLLLHIAKMLERLNFAVDMIMLGKGILLGEYKKYATVYMLEGMNVKGKEAREILYSIFDGGAHSAIANTTSSGSITQALKDAGFYVATLIHELPSIIVKQHLEKKVKSIFEYSDKIVFPAKQVIDGFESFLSEPLSNSIIRPQGLFRKNLIANTENARNLLRQRLRVPDDASVVLSIGYGDSRKGIDLFVDIGLKVLKKKLNVYFVWVGHIDKTISELIYSTAKSSGYSDNFIFEGLNFETDIYYGGADIYALTSREDPFPSVVLEALDSNLEVIAFKGVGGFDSLLARGCGQLIPECNTDAYALAVLESLTQKDKSNARGKLGHEIVSEEFSFRRYVFDLILICKAPLKRVSVIIPNYNYGEYLSERIETIAKQSYAIYEIIFLDDASTDDSANKAKLLLQELDVDHKIVKNEVNSGSPFAQWLKGIEMAKGEFVWIAEADDLAEPGFLAEVLKPMNNRDVLVSYCQSKQVDKKSSVICDSYLDYLSDVSVDKWTDYYVGNGIDEIRECLAIKNTIPNVSSAVFDRQTLLKVLRSNIEEILSYNIAGDWLTYILLLEYGEIAYSPKALNLHRRHNASVTLSSLDENQLAEIMKVQQLIRNKYEVGDDVRKKAESYARYLYQAFKLSNEGSPDLGDNKELNIYLG